MFYIKTKLESGMVVKTDITDENVFTQCCECGHELPIDLVEILSDGESDLYSISIVCSACTKKRRHSDDLKITIDGLTLLLDVLCKAGYGEQVYDLYERFEIESVQELLPEQYRPFADALSDLVTVGDSL